MDCKIAIADYQNSQQAQDIVFLLDRYASDPAGGGTGLSDRVKENLITELAQY